MNRTAAFLGLAAALALVAVLVGIRRPAPRELPPAPAPAVTDPVPVPTADAAGSLSLSGRISHPLIPVGRSEVFLTADVTGKTRADAARSPVDLALVIDRSGSMSGTKIDDAKAAARALVAQLSPTDTLTIIHYGSDVRVFGRRAADDAGREAMIAFIDRIRVDGGTNISAALQRARAQLAGSDARIRRAILISDGVPTEGETDPRILMRLADGIHAAGISVSAVGVGVDFNENLMAGIAEHGSGAYGYLKDTAALSQLFAQDLQQATRLVARDVELSFTLPDGVELGEVYGRSFTRDGRTVRVHLPDISSGQLERVVIRAVVSGEKPGQERPVADLKLAYRDIALERDAGAEVALSSSVTARAEEVLARRDARAVVDATRAQTAANLQKAADSLREGKKEEAEGLLQHNLNLFSQANEVAGKPVMEEEARWEQKTLMNAAAGAPAPAQVEDAVKAAKVRARQNFGSVGSTYSSP